MPILAANNPIVSIVPKDFISQLPPSVEQGKRTPFFRSITAGKFGEKYMENGIRLAGHLGRDIAISVGWPEDELEALTNMISSTMGVLPLQEIRAMFEQLSASIGNELAKIDDLIDAALSGVPIAGWIARVGFATWKIITQAIHMGNTPPNADVRALGYDSNQDEYITRELLKYANGKDWTDLYRPPEGDFVWKTAAYTSSGKADGVAWGQLEDNPNKLQGVVPGVGTIAGYWQSPRNKGGKMPDKKSKSYDLPKKDWAHRDDIVSQGQLLPSVVALAGQLWTNMQHEGPTLGRIDFTGLKNAWANYGDRLRSWASTQTKGSTDRGEWFRDQILAAWAWYDSKGSSGQKGYYGVPFMSVPNQYRVAGLDHLVQYKCDLAWTRCVQGLSSPAVAYVSGNAPLLRNDAGLKNVWDDKRRDLLQNPIGVRRVDVTLITDSEYRKAVAVAQKQQSSPTPQRTPSKPPLHPDLPAAPTANGGGSGLAFVLMALAGAGGIYVLKR